jgi:hypothetical protein
MTTIIPTFELKYNKETTSNCTNTNTINNNIIIKPTFEIINEIQITPENTNISTSNNITVKV